VLVQVVVQVVEVARVAAVAELVAKCKLLSI
jgi:hypothetical protein